MPGPLLELYLSAYRLVFKRFESCTEKENHAQLPPQGWLWPPQGWLWPPRNSGPPQVLPMDLNNLQFRRQFDAPALRQDGAGGQSRSTIRIAELEGERQRLADLYKALSQANKAIVHATEEAGLYQEICRVCAEFMHLDLAYVSRPESAADCLRIVAAQGHLTAYLDDLTIGHDSGSPAGLELASPCLEGHGERVCQDWNLEPRMAPWRERGRAFKIRASAAFPLRCEGRVVSVLNLLSIEPGFFSPDRLELLREIAGDASFALDRFARALQRLELEENLHQAQKMESLGTLSAGIAHDMNNILAAIMGTAELLQVAYEPSADASGYLATIVRASERGRDLVNTLTAFARKGLRETQRLDLNELVRNEMLLLQRTTLQRVEVRTELANELPAVLGEASAIASALMNLCVNAVTAMPDGGTLTLQTQELPNDLVELLVIDTGEGMQAEVLSKAMEPFFTTKPVGKGTGLGLTIAFAVLKSHGGTLQISSLPGQGTRVAMRFPAASDPTPAATGPSPEPAAVRPVRVLFVDDDDLLLEVIPQVLKSMGHTPTVARTGQEALDLLQGGLQVELVVLDQNMPGLKGSETLERLRKFKPQLPVIIATGFLDAAATAQVTSHPLLRILHKPYSRHEIRQTIDDLMAQALAS